MTKKETLSTIGQTPSRAGNSAEHSTPCHAWQLDSEAHWLVLGLAATWRLLRSARYLQHFVYYHTVYCILHLAVEFIAPRILWYSPLHPALCGTVYCIMHPVVQSISLGVACCVECPTA